MPAVIYVKQKKTGLKHKNTLLFIFIVMLENSTDIFSESFGLMTALEERSRWASKIYREFIIWGHKVLIVYTVTDFMKMLPLVFGQH